MLLFCESGLFCFDLRILCNSKAEGDLSLTGKFTAVNAVSAGCGSGAVCHDDNVRTAGNTAGRDGNKVVCHIRKLAPDTCNLDTITRINNHFNIIRCDSGNNHIGCDVLQFDRTIPMEIFNFFEEIRFDTVVSVYTQLGGVKFAKEKIELGDDFMDKYEDPSIHRKREVLDSGK